MNIRPEISDLSIVSHSDTTPTQHQARRCRCYLSESRSTRPVRPIVVQRIYRSCTRRQPHTRSSTITRLVTVAATYVECDDEQALRILLVDNRANDLATYDQSALSDLLQELAATDLGLDGTLFDGDALDDLIKDIGKDWVDRPSLEDQFGVPPFSVLDTRQGYWRTRKENWLALGIESEIGRDDDLAYRPST
jgi:hypothetical protein